MYGIWESKYDILLLCFWSEGSNLLSYDSLRFHTGIMPADAFGFEQIFLKYEQNSEEVPTGL